MTERKSLRKFVLAAIFAALIGVMTLVPYVGYINYGVIEITTLHLVVILGAVFLGPKYGTFLGGFWGVTCWLRAFTNPLFVMFTNPLISILPRILVGFLAGLVFAGFRKTKWNPYLAAGITAAVGTLTNTVLVLSALNIFGGMIKSYEEFFKMFQDMFYVIIGVNGLIELSAAIILVPILYRALRRFQQLDGAN